MSLQLNSLIIAKITLSFSRRSVNADYVKAPIFPDFGNIFAGKH